MLPHKTPRGKAALSRAKFFEGIPYPYDHKKRMVIPEALRVLRVKSTRNSCVLGDIAQLGGWTKKSVVERLEQRRKEKSQKFHALKQKKVQARAQALKHKDVSKFNAELAKHGF